MGSHCKNTFVRDGCFFKSHTVPIYFTKDKRTWGKSISGHVLNHFYIIYKLNLIVFKALNCDAPNYIQSLVSINQPPKPLRSGDKKYEPKEYRWKLKSKRYLSFHITAPCYWKILPDDVLNIKLDLNDFKKWFKPYS